jgi:predicted Zn-dependent protease with MMP-like domain
VDDQGRQPASGQLPRLARDRHGRGLRSPLLPPSLPAARSRSEVFDDLVLDAVEHVERHWKSELDGVEFGVEDVPPPLEDGVAVGDDVPLARTDPGNRRQPPRIVLYRRPMELRCRNPLDLADLVHDVVVEQIADFLGLDPDVVDGGEADEP